MYYSFAFKDMRVITHMLDVLALLVKMKELEIVSSEEGLIDRFNGIVSRKTVNHLREFGRLRNLLTHAYKSESYDELVFDSAKKSGNVRTFVEEVEKIISPSEHGNRRR